MYECTNKQNVRMIIKRFPKQEAQGEARALVLGKRSDKYTVVAADRPGRR